MVCHNLNELCVNFVLEGLKSATLLFVNLINNILNTVKRKNYMKRNTMLTLTNRLRLNCNGPPKYHYKAEMCLEISGKGRPNSTQRLVYLKTDHTLTAETQPSYLSQFVRLKLPVVDNFQL